MKELNDMVEPLVLNHIEINEFSQNQGANEKEKMNEIEENILFSEALAELQCDPLSDGKNSPTNDLTPYSKVLIGCESENIQNFERDPLHISMELQEVEDEDMEKEKKEMKVEFFEKKTKLRPRKTEINFEDGIRKKKLRNGNVKMDKNNINQKAENNVAHSENFTTGEAFQNLKTNSGLNFTIKSSVLTERDSEIISEPKAEGNEFYLKSVSLENENGNSESISSSSDNKSEDNCKSETNNSSFEKKKRKRKKDLGNSWSKKKRKNDGAPAKLNDSGLSFHNTCGISSPLPVDNASNKGNCIEGADNSQKKNREFVVPSPSLADISMKAAIPESTATSLETPKPHVCLCRKKPQVFISGNNNTSNLYCQALDCIDNKIVGCCNKIPSQDVGLFRASVKTSYQMMCDVHHQRLSRHNCCPGCGLFCTQGKFLMCKSSHHFHKTCCPENKNNKIVCLHCGDDSHVKSILISIHSARNPAFLPHQKLIKRTAKISIAKGQSLVVEEEKDFSFEFLSKLLPDAGIGDGLKNGLTQNLDKGKLTPLLNIACRSFSKTCSSNRYSYKSLYNASQNGDVEKLLKIIASGFNPNHVFEENNKQTALHLAAANGNLPVIHILLQAKAQIDAFNGEQNTPLTIAINAKHNEIVKYLIKCGASLTLKSEDGMTPLHIAAKCGNVGACFHILNGTNLPPRYIDGSDDGGWTPIVWASEFNHLEAVKFLISKGADPLIKDTEQNIALHWAAFGGSIDIVELYLNNGSDINAVNVHGDTPLHIAARQDKYDCVLLLLARGAKSDIKNKNGELPRDCSESHASDIYKGITLNMEISALLTRFQDRTPRIVSNDISRGKEKNQIQCVNGVDDEGEPNDYIYVNENCFTSKIIIDKTINTLQSCKCENGCTSEECNCAIISMKCWYDNDGKLKSDFNYVDPPLIFECNQACLCNRITCRNRVVQNGICCRFQLFRTETKGWGIKTLNFIPKGTYVCEYIGEIISDSDADRREDDSYLFDLDNRDGETYCIDARHYGNFARFINHSCVPNLMPVHVFVDHQDIRFPRIAFFASKDIFPDEELGYNYGEKFWIIKWSSFTCTCGAEKCMYSEKTIQATLENYKKKIEENPLE